MTEHIIIDTDPGIDDTMAILFALKSPELDVVALTTIFGNHFTDITTRNALRVLELAGRSEIPVAHGAEGPLLRKYKGPPHFVHGHDGLGDAGVAAEPQHLAHHLPAAQFIVETIMARPREITLVPVGPLTNIALALRLEPRIAENVKRVVLMGGTGFAPGNVSPVAEANIHNDPEAAAIVFGAPWHVTMIGLDVTTQVLMDEPYLQELAAAPNPYTDLISKIVSHYQRFHGAHYISGGAIHTHDPSAIAYLINPELFETVSHRVRVETHGYADGQVIVDRRGRWYEGVETEIAVRVNAPRLLALFKERLTA